MSRSEDSYRTDLINAINTKLPSPYKAYNSQSITIDKDDKRIAILKKLKREFDVVILDENFASDKKINIDRIEIAIETKKLGSECSGIEQAEDAFTAFPNLVHTIATNFESNIYHRKRNDPEENIALKSSILEKKYNEIADFICICIKKIIESKREVKKDISEKEVINVLYDCMDTIQKQMTELSDESKTALTERTLIMWQKSDEKSGEMEYLDYNIKRASSYIIVDQLLFYDLLQRHNTKYKLPPLKPLDPETEVPSFLYTKYMQRAIDLTGDYKPIFDIDVLSLLPESASVINAINEVIDKITRLKLSAGNTDFIGKIFHKMIPSEIRKGLAAYYTGSAPARLLATLALKKSDMKVCDLACGSGTLLVESYHILKDLYKKEHPEMTEEQMHKQILENQIYGNDITLFASHLAAMNLASQYLDGDVSKLNITSTDGLQINPNGIPISTTRGLFKYIKHGYEKEKLDTVEMKESYSITYPHCDCIIMNPPFSRQTDMSKDILNNLNNIVKKWFNNKEIEEYIDKKMGLHGYFMLHADHLLKNGGIIAMVLPTSTFTTDYTDKLLAYLKSKKYAIEYVIEILSKRSAFSEDCTFKEYMIICQKGLLTEKSHTKLISIKADFSIDIIKAISTQILNGSDNAMIMTKNIPTSEMYASKKWTEIFVVKNDIIDQILSSSKLENYECNTSGIKISRGYDGTYSEYLMLPNKEWTISRINPNTFRLDHIIIPERDDQRSCQIPAKYLIPAIRDYDHINHLKSDADRWVLNLPPELPYELIDFQRRYISWAEKSIESRWESDTKKGNKRIPIIKKATWNKDDKSKYESTPWFHHAQKNKCDQIKIQIVVFNKIYTNSARTTICYIPVKISLNHTFLTMQSPQDDFLACWCNSACYLYSLFTTSQAISKGFIKMQIGDFAHVKFPKYSAFEEPTKTDLIAKWQSLADVKDLPFLPEQFGAKIVKQKGKPMKIESCNPTPERVALDKAWLKAFGVADTDIQKTLDELYAWLRDYMTTR